MQLEALIFVSLVATVYYNSVNQPSYESVSDEESDDVQDEKEVAVEQPNAVVAQRSAPIKVETKPKRSQNGLSLKNLGRLAKSNTIAVRDSALQILLTRAISDDYFGEIMLLCWDPKDSEMRDQAICVIQQLSRIESNRPRLVKFGALKMLAHTINSKNSDKTTRNAMVALYRLILNKTHRKVFLVKVGVLDRITDFLTNPGYSNDLRYWSLLVIHQFSLCEHLHPILIFKGLIPILGSMTRSTFGNSNMQKYCLHSLVRLISSLKSTEAASKLQVLLDMNLVSLIGACLKNEDGELVSWAIFLIQEFVTRDVARVEFASVRGIAKILSDSISHPSSGIDSFMPRVTLRTLKCLSLRNEGFQGEVLKAGILKKVVPFLESADNEAQFWAVSLLHDLTGNNNDYHQQFLALKGLDALIRMSNTASTDVCLYVSDILIFLCGVGQNRQTILQSDILSAVFIFCKSEEPDLQYGGTLLLLNISTFSVESALKIADNDGIEILSELVLASGRQDLQVVGAKALATMARKEYEVHDEIFRQAVQEIVIKINSLKYNASSSNDLHTFLECFQIFIQPDFLKPPPVPDYPHRNETFVFQNLDWNQHIEPLCQRVIDMLLFPFINDSLNVEEEFDGVAENEFALIKDDVNQTLYYRIEQVAQELREVQDRHLFEEVEGGEVMDQNTRYFFAFKGLSILIPLFQNEQVRRFFESNSISVILISLIRLNSKVLCNQAIAALGMCLQQGLSRESLSSIPNLMDSLLSHILVEESPATKFYGNVIFDYMADFSSHDMFQTTEEAVAEVDLNSMTPFLYWSKDKLEVRNDSWTFESARCNVSVTGEGKYAYEVTLNTDGIIQIGWVTETCNFDPEGGEGVGDNAFSYAYDGNRVKKWHSFFTTNNSYGEEWTSGDVITVLIDLDEKTVSYLRNGNDLGVAFTNVDSKLNWYPAVSLAGSQGCAFTFGGANDALRYKPESYSTIASTVELAEETTESLSASDISCSVEVLEDEASIVDSDHEWKVPSFYYETRLSLFKNPENFCPIQFGLIDNQGSLVVLVPVQDNKACILSLSCESPTQSVLLETLHLTAHSLLDNEDVGTEVKLLAVIQLFSIKDGDILGCGFGVAESCIWFTINGHAF
ncbi:UNVERIFIED_CONTAM: hypothetical protein HDU68_003633, partial [Siphonaria sp. JEL0065]